MKSGTNSQPPMLQRIFWLGIESEQRFLETVRLLEDHRDAVDEVYLFTEGDGQDFRYINPDEVTRRAAIIKDRIAYLTARGFSASINVLNTIGHSDYAESYVEPLPWGGMVGPDGAMSTCCSCPRQPAFRDYVVHKYKAYAGCKPRWIWIDDDVRLCNHYWHVFHGCFCDVCMKEFSRRVGRNWNREDLYRAITLDTYPQVNQDRAQWMKFLSDQIVEIHGLIRETVHHVDPTIGMAAMNVGFESSAYYSHFADRYNVLRTDGETVIRARPGGGAFTDERPVERYHKAWSIAFQRTQYPHRTESFAEIENYPFQFFEKSVASTLCEGSLYLAAGCDGLMVDTLGNLGNAPVEHAPYLAGLGGRKFYYTQIRDTLLGAKPLGINVACCPEHAALAPSNGTALESTDIRDFAQACGWGFLGIPLRFAAENSAPSFLCGSLAKGMPREMLESILSRGAVMDVVALDHLWAVGLGEKVGVKVAGRFDNGVAEVFADHPLNAGFTGYLREVLQGYYPSVAATFESTGADMAPLAYLQTYRKARLGPCAVSIESSTGARFVILGYRPWDYLGLPGKTRQCRQIADWICHGRLPVRMDTHAKAVIFAYDLARGGHAACVINASDDPIASPVLQFSEVVSDIQCLFPKARSWQALPNLSGAKHVKLPEIPARGDCLIQWR